MPFKVDRAAYMVTLIMKFKHKRLSLLDFMLVQVKVRLREVGLAQVNMFYIRQACQWKFLVKV